jgi:hypothetical protein
MELKMAVVSTRFAGCYENEGDPNRRDMDLLGKTSGCRRGEIGHW